MASRYRIEEVAARIGVGAETLALYVRRSWITPFGEFDDEDLARARLVHELIDELGVNEEAVPIILRLLDQIHALHCEIRRRSAA
jgi:chaperone modulatory protein CbpM